LVDEVANVLQKCPDFRGGKPKKKGSEKKKEEDT